jgi:hypothetical protein
MATNLTKLKIKEISLVDRPASPDSDVILMKRAVVPNFSKRDVTDEARDDRGRWTAGRVAAVAGGAALAAGALYLGAPHLARFARHAAATAPGAARAAGSFIGTNAPKVAQGIAAASSAVAGAKLVAQNAGNAARSLGLKSVEQSRNGTRLVLDGKIGELRIKRNVEINHDSVRNALGIGAARATRTAEGSPDPRNEEPIVTSRSAAPNGAKIPLNSPSINWRNAGGWSYKTAAGDYVPSGSSDQQKFIETALDRQDTRLPISSVSASGGRPYRTRQNDIVPGGSRAAQGAMEERYRLERLRESSLRKCVSIFSEISGPRLLPVVIPTRLFS